MSISISEQVLFMIASIEFKDGVDANPQDLIDCLLAYKGIEIDLEQSVKYIKQYHGY